MGNAGRIKGGGMVGQEGTVGRGVNCILPHRLPRCEGRRHESLRGDALVMDCHSLNPVRKYLACKAKSFPENLSFSTRLCLIY